MKIVVISILGLLCSLDLGQSASVPAVEFDGRQQGGVLALRGTTTGWEFTPLTDIMVDKLGLYDDHAGGGFGQAHTIGLWRADGTWLTQVQLPAGEASPLDGNFRYVAVTPAIRLNAYVPCVIAASYADGGSDLILNFGPRVDPNIRVDALRNAGAASFRFPEGRDPNSGGNFGPGFTFVSLPSDPGDVAITLRLVSGTYGYVGEPMDFALAITNRGGILASNVMVRIRNSLPGTLPFQRTSSSQGGCHLEGDALVCAVGNMVPNASALVSFGSTSPGADSVAFEAQASSPTPDPLPANNAATNTVRVYHPLFSVSGGTQAEGRTFQFNLTVNPPLSRPMTARFETSDNGTAMAGQDYVATNGTVIFAPGESTKTIGIASLQDSDLERNESFFLVAYPELTAIPASGTGVILDDDSPTLPFVESFEDPRLSPAAWTPSTPWTPDAPMVSLFLNATGQAHGGTNELALAPAAAGGIGRPVSAILRLKVDNDTGLMLSFWARYGLGSPESFGLGIVGVDVNVDGINAITVPAAISGLTTVHRRFEIPLDPILAQAALNNAGTIGIRFFNYPRYYGPMLGHPGTLYNHALYIDDVQVTGCPKDGAAHLAQPQLRDGSLRFHLATCPGQAYQLEFSDDLRDPQWRFLESFVGDGALRTIDVPSGPGPQRFYRVVPF